MQDAEQLDCTTAVFMGCLMRRIALAVVLVALLPWVAEGQDWPDSQIGPGRILQITVCGNDAMS